jgi:chromosome segregation ATPase
MVVESKSQQAEVERHSVGRPSLLWLLSLWGCGAAILYALATGLGGVVALDIDRAAYEKQQTDDKAALESLRQDVSRQRDEAANLARQAATLRSELQTTTAQKLKAVDQTAAAQADLKAAGDEYQVEQQRLRTIEAEHARLTADVTALKQRSEQAASVAARLAEENTTLEERKSKLTADVEGLTSKRDSLLADLKQTNTALTDVESRLADERKKLLDKQKELGEASAALVPLAAEAKRIDTLIAREATLNAQITGLSAKATTAQKQVEDLATKEMTLKSEVEKLQDEVTISRSLVNATREIRDRIDALNSAEAAASKRKASIEIEAKAAEAEAKAAVQLKNELPAIQTKKAELEAELKTLRDTAATTKATLDAETTAMRTANDKQRADKAALAVEIDELRDEIKRKSSALKAIDEGPTAKPASPTTPEKPTTSP